MLVSVYYPFSDERALFPGRSSLVQSRFSKLDELHRFYRNLGDIIDRPSGGFLGWIGENSICAVRSIDVLLDEWSGDKRLQNAPQVAFKRMFFDGLHGGYFSVGLNIRGTSFEQSVDGGTLIDVLGALATIPVNSGHRPSLQNTLASYGALALDLYASGSVRRLKDLSSAGYRESVFSGPPIIIVSMKRAGAQDSFGKRQRLSLRSPTAVSALNQETFGWFIDWQQPDPTFVFVIASQTATDAADSRFLRAGVARLYVEMFLLERLIALLQSPLFETCDEEGRGIIRASVNRAIRRLHGADRPTIADTERSYNALVATFAQIFKPGHVAELDNILTRLEARPNLRRAIQRSYLIDQQAASLAITIEGDFVMGTKNVQTGGISISGSTVGGDVFQGTKTTNINYREEAVRALEPVAAAVQAAPPDKKADAEQKLKELQDEAAKGKDAKDGVMAKLVDGLVGLVPTAVSAVVSAFGTPILGGIAGPATKYVLDKIQGK